MKRSNPLNFFSKASLRHETSIHEPLTSFVLRTAPIVEEQPRILAISRGPFVDDYHNCWQCNSVSDLPNVWLMAMSSWFLKGYITVWFQPS